MIKKIEFSIPSSHKAKTLTFDITTKTTEWKQPLVIFLHGFKGFKDWGHFNSIAEAFAENNFTFLKLNFSHNGTSPNSLNDFVDLEAFGNNNFSKEIKDIDDLLNYLFNHKSDFQNIDFENIILIGHSKGGATAIIKGNEDPRIKKVITWNGVVFLKDRYASELDKWKKDGVLYIENSRTNQTMPIYYQLAEDVLNNIERFNISQIVGKTEKPIFAIHSREDQTVSIEEPLRIKHKYKCLSILEYGSHTFDGVHPYNEKKLPDSTLKAIDKTIDFIKS